MHLVKFSVSQSSFNVLFIATGGEWRTRRLFNGRARRESNLIFLWGNAVRISDKMQQPIARFGPEKFCARRPWFWRNPGSLRTQNFKSRAFELLNLGGDDLNSDSRASDSWIQTRLGS